MLNIKNVFITSLSFGSQIQDHIVIANSKEDALKTPSEYYSEATVLYLLPLEYILNLAQTMTSEDELVIQVEVIDEKINISEYVENKHLVPENAFKLSFEDVTQILEQSIDKLNEENINPLIYSNFQLE